MSLYDRVAQVKKIDFDETVSLPDEGRRQLLDSLNRKIHLSLVEELGPELYDNKVSEAQLKTKVLQKLMELIGQEQANLISTEKAYLIKEITQDILGYGPIEPFLKDPEVTEVMVNRADKIYIEKFGKIYTTDAKFIDEGHLRRVIDKIVSRVGRRVDESVPMVDARLPDGSRVNAVISPVALNGAKLTIRKFAAEPYQVKDLINFGTMTEAIARFLDACVQGRLNVIVSGGTGSGKTTTLNVLSSFIPADERIITIEDAAELQLHQEHVLQLESRPPNIEGRGQITVRDLVRNALRMRPDRIVVGEVRGGEALDMLQAMNTGHDGSLSTVHANSPRDVISRLETMVLMSGMDLPVRAIREQISSAIDLIIHQARLKDGSRRITHLTEVQGMEGDVVTLQDIFVFDFSKGIDADGKFRGKIKSTGIRPKFMQRLEDIGITVPAETFQIEVE